MSAVNASEVEKELKEVEQNASHGSHLLNPGDLVWITPQLYEKYQKWCDRFTEFRGRISRSEIFTYHQFNPENLEEEIRRQPSCVYYVLELYAEAKYLESYLEQLIDEVEAKLDTMYRYTLENSGEKVTEGKIRGHVVAHPLYSDMKSRLSAVVYLASRIQAVREALSNKKEMIITYAVNVRLAREVDGFALRKEVC